MRNPTEHGPQMEGWLLHARHCTCHEISPVKFCADCKSLLGETACSSCQSLVDYTNTKITLHALKMSEPSKWKCQSHQSENVRAIKVKMLEPSKWKYQSLQSENVRAFKVKNIRAFKVKMSERSRWKCQCLQSKHIRAFKVKISVFKAFKLDTIQKKKKRKQKQEIWGGKYLFY